jgi:hypothetical protein
MDVVSLQTSYTFLSAVVFASKASAGASNIVPSLLKML